MDRYLESPQHAVIEIDMAAIKNEAGVVVAIGDGDWTPRIPLPRFGAAGKIYAALVRKGVGGNVTEIDLAIVRGDKCADSVQPAAEWVFAEWTGETLTASAKAGTVLTSIDPPGIYSVKAAGSTDGNFGRPCIMIKATTDGDDATGILYVRLSYAVFLGRDN